MAKVGSSKKAPLSRLKAAYNNVNTEARGSDAEYFETILAEFRSLSPFRKRANRHALR